MTCLPHKEDPSATPGHLRCTLATEHAPLRTQITELATDVLAKADAGSWPCSALDQLLDYLHLELLKQFAAEEWPLFRHLHQDRAALDRVREGHRRLRDQIRQLNDAAHAEPQRPHL